jgi:hypothetical protein
VASETNQPRRGPSDATDYSSTKAPETQSAAENRDHDPSDPRLRPGGAHGAPWDPGMSSLDRGEHPTGAVRPGEQDFGKTEDVKV